jgi:sec-independent protein translocase protein TatC
MTLLDHLRELRSRLFKAALSVTAGFVVGWIFASRVRTLLQAPYCDYMAQQTVKKLGHLPDGYQCAMVMLEPSAGLVLQMKIALWLGLIISSPIWLYQLWAFIAPGLHRNERRWAYWFVGFAAPLFAGGAVLAYFVVGRGLEFLLQFAGGATVSLEITRYFSFVSGLILLFGIAFEFPLVVVLFNLAGLATYKRLLGWWRIAVFSFFAFSAVAIPTGDPFSMSALGLALTAMYFAAVGFAYFNDKRRARRQREQYGDLSDDAISQLDYDVDSVEAGEPIHISEPVGAPEPVERPRAIDSRYDDMT